MLKLFFGRFAAPGAVVAVAREQVSVHEAATAELRQIRERLLASPEREHQLAVCEMALTTIEALIDSWRALADGSA